MWLCCLVTWEEIDELVQERRNSIANALELRLSCTVTWEEVDELVQERRNSIANALELRLSCTNLSKWVMTISHPLRSWKKCPLPGKKSWQETSEFWWIMYYAPKWLLHMALYQAWFPNIQPIPAIKHFFQPWCPMEWALLLWWPDFMLCCQQVRPIYWVTPTGITYIPDRVTPWGMPLTRIRLSHSLLARHSAGNFYTIRVLLGTVSGFQ